jgi:hypothetical protein
MDWFGRNVMAVGIIQFISYLYNSPEANYKVSTARKKEKKTTTIIQFNSLFIYVLRPTANGRLQNQHEYKQQQQ